MELHESIPEDDGNYSCIVTNPFGSISRHFIVEVQPRTVAEKPIIEPKKPGNFTVLVGSNLTMDCPVINEESYDPSVMTWSKTHWGQEGYDEPYYEGTNKTKFDQVQHCSSDGGQCFSVYNDSFSVPDAKKFVMTFLTLNDSAEYW